MCRELRELQQSIVAFASRFDASSLTPAQAAEVVGLSARMEASAASVKALAAARMATGRGWDQGGYRSAADQLADQAGMSPGAAKRALEAGRCLSEQPEVARAALAGELSSEQTSAVTQGVSADPAKAGELIDKAKSGSLAELHEAVAKVRAEATDLEEQRRRRHAKRSLRKWTDLDGALDARLRGHPEDGALLWRMLDPVRRRLNAMRRQAGADPDPLDALDYDALMTIAAVAVGKEAELSFSDLVHMGLFRQAGASAATAGPMAPDLFTGTQPPGGPAGPQLPEVGRRPKKMAGSPLRVMVRVDLEALLRGFPIRGELCEIPGYGPVPVSVVEDLLATESPFIVGILTRGERLVGVYHHGRHPNAHQRSALDFLYPSCAVAGCSSTAGLQYDHRVDWARSRITAFDLLDRLCPHHHRKKTNDGWALVHGRGKRAFVPPDDPRHPHSRRDGPDADEPVPVRV